MRRVDTSVCETCATRLWALTLHRPGFTGSLLLIKIIRSSPVICRLETGSLWSCSDQTGVCRRSRGQWGWEEPAERLRLTRWGQRVQRPHVFCRRFLPFSVFHLLTLSAIGRGLLLEAPFHLKAVHIIILSPLSLTTSVLD